MVRQFGVVGVLTAFVLLTPLRVSAEDYLFKPDQYARTGAWHIDENWVPQGHPGAADTATIGPLVDPEGQTYYPACKVLFEVAIGDLVVQGAGGGG